MYPQNNPGQPAQYGSPYPTGYEPPQQPRRVKNSRRVIERLIWAITAFVMLGIGIAIGAASAPKASAAPQPTATVTVHAAGPTATTAAKAKPAGPRTSFGDGTWQVGKDIAAGVYTGTAPKDAPGCFWARFKTLNTEDADSIIADDVITPGGHVTVSIKSTDKAFKTQGCGTLTRQ